MSGQKTNAGLPAATRAETLSETPGICGSCAFKPCCLPAKLEGKALEAFEHAISRPMLPIKAGQGLVRQGDPVHVLYALRVGVLKVDVKQDDGSERVVGFRFPGRVIGLAETGLDRWVRTFVALEDCWVCRIPMTLLDRAGLAHELAKLTSNRLHREYECYLALAAKTTAGRLATFLLRMSESQRRRGLAPNRFTLPMTHGDIASYLGMRHESVCRALAELKRRGLVQQEGRHFAIPSLEALRAL